MIKLNWQVCVRMLLVLVTFIVSLSVRADITLHGNMKIGDDEGAINPNFLVTESASTGAFVPVHPIHFALNNPFTLKQIKLMNAKAVHDSLYFVIWDSNSKVVVNKRSSNTSDAASQALNQTLPAGNYTMAIFGQCGLLWGNGWANHCDNNEDFEFTDIQLVGPTTGENWSFIQRRHIGDSDEREDDDYAGRWYPDSAEGKQVVYRFNTTTPAYLQSITIYNFRDVIINSNAIKIKVKHGNHVMRTTLNAPRETGDFTWEINEPMLLNKDYTLTITATGKDDKDDLSWDDIVIKIGPDSSSNNINHYRLSYAPRALTCEPAVVIVQACSNAFQPGAACVESQQRTSATLMARANSGGVVNKPSGRFVGSTTINLGYLQADDLTLSLNGIGNKPYYCNGLGNCQINFADSGFFFSDNTANANPIDNQVAAVNFPDPIQLQAFYNDDGKCANIFDNEKVSVKLGLQCQEPNTCTSLDFLADGVALGKNSANQTGNYSTVDLQFKNNTATIPAQYQDAGKIRLRARHTIDDSNSDLNGLTITGDSNEFAVRPARFTVQAIGTAGQHLTDMSNNNFVHTYAAGANFDARVAAVNAAGVITLNYKPAGNSSLQLKVTRRIPALDGVDGLFKYSDTEEIASNGQWQANAGLAPFINGLSSYTAGYYSEVGAIAVNVKDTDYYGMQFALGRSDSDAGQQIGRFIPDHFQLVSADVVNYVDNNTKQADYTFPNGADNYVAGTKVIQPKNGRMYQCRKWPYGGYCQQWSRGSTQYEPGSGLYWRNAWIELEVQQSGVAFTYMDQPALGFDYQLEAQNSLGAVTRNYDGNSKAKVSFHARAANIDYSSRLQDFAGVWCQGIYQPESCSATTSDNGYFARLETGPDGPIANTLFGIGIVDNDGVLQADVDMATAVGVANARRLSDQGSTLKYGRWQIADGYGPSSAAFPVTMQLQYYDGSQFVLNRQDNLTTFTALDASLRDVSLGGSMPLLTGSGLFSGGSTQGLQIAAPHRGGQVALSYAVPAWLEYDWTGSSNDFNQPPLANIVFGFFYGNDRVIYRRRLN